MLSSLRPRRRRAVGVVVGVLLVTGGTVVVMDRHGVRAQAACADVDVVVARGTGEPGPLGQVVGDPVFAAMQKVVTNKQLAASPVAYPASLAAGSAGIGNTNLVNMVTAQLTACPDQRFVLVGYSQGANVVDNSLGVSSAGALVGSPITAVLPAGAQAKVDAILLFGNPIRAQGGGITGADAARTMDVCAAGDPICMAGGNNVAAHLSYTQNALTAAMFAGRLIATGGSAAPNAGVSNTMSVNNAAGAAAGDFTVTGGGSATRRGGSRW